MQTVWTLLQNTAIFKSFHQKMLIRHMSALFKTIHKLHSESNQTKISRIKIAADSVTVFVQKR